MHTSLRLAAIALALGCGKEEASKSTDSCSADFSLEFTGPDGETDTVTMNGCGGIDIDAGFEWTDDAHLRYIGVAFQAESGGNCYVALVVDPYCGDDVYTIDGPAGWSAKTTLVLEDCPDLPEGAATTWTLDEGEVDMIVGFKHPGDSPGKAIRTAPVGSIDATGVEGDLTINLTGEFKLDRRTTAGEVSETICD